MKMNRLESIPTQLIRDDSWWFVQLLPFQSRSICYSISICFNSVIFVVMVKQWWKWTPWKGENSVAQQTTYNLHQSASNYRSLHNVAVPVFHVAMCILGTSGTLASWPPTPGNQHSTEQNQRQCFIWIHSTCFAWRVPKWAPCVPPLANRHSQSRDLIRHFKFSIPCEVFCIHSRCPRTLSLLQKFRQKHLRFKPAFTSSARMFRRILVQSILGSDRTFAWSQFGDSEYWRSRAPKTGLPASMSTKGQAIAWLLSGVITPLVPTAQFYHTFFAAKKIPTNNSCRTPVKLHLIPRRTGSIFSGWTFIKGTQIYKTDQKFLVPLCRSWI